jgi:hypothetical protein
MSSKHMRDMPVATLQERWRSNIEYIAEEANDLAVHLKRYETVSGWIFERPHRRWANRHSQAFGWITMLWLEFAMMYIRRELDDQSGVVSLGQLFREMESRPDATPNSLPASTVTADRIALNKQCEELVSFAHRTIAHRAPSHEGMFAGGNMRPAIDAIRSVVQKYYKALIGRALTSAPCEPLDPAWLQSFVVPWYKPRKKEREQLDRYFRSMNR